MPAELLKLQTSDVLAGLGLDVDRLMEITKVHGVDGLATVPLRAEQAPTIPAASDKGSLVALNNLLGVRVDDLVMSALKTTEAPPHGERLRRGRKKDTLDRLISEAAARARTDGSEG
jgi:hypothetical protein